MKFGQFPEPRWPGGKMSASGPEGTKFENRFDPRPTVSIGLVHVKSDVEGTITSRWCGVEFWRKESHLRCYPGHPTMIQNYEIRLEKTRELLQTATFK
ncbi:hypothetical protein AVEN_100701-1 [Araneus ventricosus]|uniref:Uncharacterized protein n=1 Tax=Araneus ventricosus TaxID=182803 RepID=A0A4Y2CT13_ARAVE|nr:hypothetical protein AVEN_100701-1 [Araneus ventricosus]